MLCVGVLFVCYVWEFCLCAICGSFVCVLCVGVLFVCYVWEFCLCAMRGSFVCSKYCRDSSEIMLEEGAPIANPSSCNIAFSLFLK